MSGFLYIFRILILKRELSNEEALDAHDFLDDISVSQIGVVFSVK